MMFDDLEKLSRSTWTSTPAMATHTDSRYTIGEQGELCMPKTTHYFTDEQLWHRTCTSAANKSKRESAMCAEMA